MKRVIGLLNIILCLELIIGPFAPTVSLFAPSSVLAADCPSGFQHDPTLNRCLTSAQTAKVMNAVANCPANDAACYRKNAESAFADKESKGEVSKNKEDMHSFVSTVANAAVMSVAITAATTALASVTSTCQSVSYWSLVAGGAAVFAGDLLANMGHRKRLKKIKEDWDKIIKPNAGAETNSDVKKANATEAQSQSFEMLARSEDSLASAAKMKSKFYAVATTAFAVSAALATYESFEVYGAAKNTCATGAPAPTTPAPSTFAPKAFGPDPVFAHNKFEYPNPKKPLFWSQDLFEKQQVIIAESKDLASFYVLNQSDITSNASPLISQYDYYSNALEDFDKNVPELLAFLKVYSKKLINNLSPISSVHARTEKQNEKVIIGSVVFGAGVTYMMGDYIKKALTTPWQRAVIGGVLAGWSGIMWKHTKSQAKASQNRADVLRKMRDEFRDASGAINMCSAADRSNISKPECYCYTSEGQRNNSRTNSQTCQKLWAGNLAANGNYFGNDGSLIKGCIAQNGQPDEACNCRKSNTCLKVNMNNLRGFNPGSFRMLTSSTTPINQLGNGTFEAANVSEAGLMNNAMRIQKATEEMQNKKGLGKLRKKQSAQVEKSLVTASGANRSAVASSGSAAPMNPAQAISELEKEFEKADAPINTASSGDSLGQPGAPVEQLDFGFSKDEITDPNSQLADAMNQELDYGQTDINQGKSTNIFEVLSNRYQRSGMRRLFDDEGKAKIEPPATSDITE